MNETGSQKVKGSTDQTSDQPDGAHLSPFDLPVLDIEFLLRWERPLAAEFPALLLSRLLRASLWRRFCQRGEGAASCAAGAKEPKCASPEACLAQAAFPLPGQSRSHHVGVVSLHTRFYRDQTSHLVLRLLGDSGARIRTAAVEALMAITGEGLRTQGGPCKADCVQLGERTYTVAQLAMDLSAAQAWRIRLLSPWVAGKTGSSEQGEPSGLAGFLGSFALDAAQRVYKFIALNLAERSRNGRPLADGKVAHAVCLETRDLAREELLRLAIDEARIVHWRQDEVSSSNNHKMRLSCISGELHVSAPGSEAPPSLAGWLAILDVLGGGEMTSEGYGALAVEPITS